MNKQIIEKAFNNIIGQGTPEAWTILDRLGYQIYNELYPLYFITMYNGKPEIYITPRVLYENINSKLVEDIHQADFIKKVREKEPNVWIHVNISAAYNDTYILGEDFYGCLNSAPRGSTKGIFMYCKNEEVAKRLALYISKFEDKKAKYFNYITTYNGTFGHSTFELPPNLSIPLDNYLPDFPYDKLKSFCEADTPGIFLLYGEPGCGKSFMIRKLIQDCDTEFFILDASILNNITASTFIDYLTDECSNCVLILEDCEKILMDRNTTYNPFLGTILNLADGLLGDALKLKFICTFNTAVENIDPAVLRKGRLYGKYEFRKLPKDRVNSICKMLNVPELNKEATLADIYNADENDFSKKETRRIGF